MKRIDLTNKTIGAWKVLGFDDSDNRNWICECQRCKNVFSVNGMALRKGRTSMCRSCYEKEHSKSKDWLSLKIVFKGIKQRCYYPKANRYADYGGRGIKVCDEWLNDKDAFPKWALANGYKKGLSIDRINPNGDYCPNNCRFVDAKAQNNNRRYNIFITFDGKTQTIGQWAKELNMSRATIKWRYSKGWEAKDILKP